MSSQRVAALKVSQAKERSIALVAVFLAGCAFPIGLGGLGITTTTLVTLALLPVWFPHVLNYQYTRPLSLGIFACLVAGSLLALLATPVRSVNPSNALATVLLIATTLGLVGLLLWARQLLLAGTLAVCYGSGAVLVGILQSPGSVNPWKFELALPVTIVVLGLLWRRKTLWNVLALLAIAAVSIVLDYRSFFGFCLLAAAVIIAMRVRPGQTTSRWGIALAFVIGVGGLYTLGSTLLVGGYLGDNLQQRSIEQVERGGSLISGGRPEWTATWQLMQDQPMGYGIGVRPTPGDVWIAKEGLAGVGIQTNNGYVDNFMFGGEYKLHSIIADFWAKFGIVGLIFAVYVTYVLVRLLIDYIAAGAATALGIVLLITGIWDMAFGPIRSNLPDVAFALGLLLPLFHAANRRPEKQPVPVEVDS